ncbi:MAG: HD domain-containing phosphohydrolase [Pseudomonadota bacterium]
MSDSDRFYNLPLATLLTGTVPDFPLYLAESGGTHFVLYRQEGMTVSPEHLECLRQHHEDKVYIRAEDRVRQQRYMVQTTQECLADPSRSSREKAEVVYVSAQSALKAAFGEPNAANLDTCRQLATVHVNYIVSDPCALSSLLRIVSYDYYAHTHSINVCTFTVAICLRLGMDPQRLVTIGTGALLHDIGKICIVPSILNKPGRLNESETEIIRKHPEMGIEMLNDIGPLPPEGAEIVLNHHEKCDGTGYPKGLKRDETGVAARACCLADIYDALTTHRCYKSACRGFQALKLMREMHGQLDEELLAVLIRLVGRLSREMEQDS